MSTQYHVKCKCSKLLPTDFENSFTDILRTTITIQRWLKIPVHLKISPQYLVIRPLSDTMSLWSGSSYRAFVYIGNDGFCFAADCKHNNRNDKCRFFFGFQVIQRNSRIGPLMQVEIHSLTQNVIAIVNKKPWTALCHLTKELSAT